MSVDPEFDRPWALRGARVVTAAGLGPATVIIAGERVVEVVPGHARVSGVATTVDAGNAVVMPGVVDAHVHINEPGRTAWEGFATAGRAAAAGGVTTLVDMPLNSTPVTIDAWAVAAKRARIGRCQVDVGLWGGLVPANAHRMDTLLDSGALGVKCFLCDAGIPDFPPVAVSDLRRAMPALAARGRPLLAHAEWPAILDAAPRPAASRRYRDWLASRPAEAEAEAIARLADLAAETGCAVHVVHVASAEALSVLRAARQRGIDISGETCPHYLTFAAEEIADGAVAWKCAPPIRSRRHRAALWQGLEAGDLRFVASDHSPCPPNLKRFEDGDLMAAWGGIASLQLTLPVTWTCARGRGHGIERLADWLAARPAERAGLGTRKGRIAPGYDADFVLWHPERRFAVQPPVLHHRHPTTPYAGRVLEGVVERTWSRGRLVFDRGRFPQTAAGRWLEASPHPA